MNKTLNKNIFKINIYQEFNIINKIKLPLNKLYRFDLIDIVYNDKLTKRKIKVYNNDVIQEALISSNKYYKEYSGREFKVTSIYL